MLEDEPHAPLISIRETCGVGLASDVTCASAGDLAAMHSFSGKAIRRILNSLLRRRLIQPDGSILVADVKACDRGIFVSAVRRSRDLPEALAEVGTSSQTALPLAWVYLRSRLSQYKKNAAKRGIEFELTKRDLAALYTQSGGRCAVTGIEFTIEKFGSVRSPFAPSVDRIDCNQGYKWSNVRLTCQIANLAMNVWGSDVLEEFLTRAASSFHRVKKP